MIWKGKNLKIVSDVCKCLLKYDHLYYLLILDGSESINELEKADGERSSLKRNVKKKNEQTNEHFIFKKPETPTKSTSPVT